MAETPLAFIATKPLCYSVRWFKYCLTWSRFHSSFSPPHSSPLRAQLSSVFSTYTPTPLPPCLFVSQAITYCALQRGENTCFDSYDNWLNVICLEERVPQCSIGILCTRSLLCAGFVCVWVKQLGVGPAQCDVLASWMFVCAFVPLCLPVPLSQTERVYEQSCACLSFQLCVYMELSHKWRLVEWDKWGLYALTSACVPLLVLTVYSHANVSLPCKNNEITQSKSTPLWVS